MATPLMCMLYTGLRLCRSTFPGTGVRLFSCGAVQQAGSKWRLEHGMARSNSEYGPFTDLPDWSFADGRPAPPCKGELRRRKEREEFAGGNAESRS
ncbi:39S ribosomal protein L52, mitochondrial isoform X2 [Protopterus annectens]|uniref:39S ribosomal protein L52, mitochondrial isoform X2 n=1 Tax=Protopterus annectens TaxID=7888 RepID=UPI001CFBCAA0|nr:39S ribosomal protein L52, mitochondrial isoform X2 [Protopterus annectens]